MRTVNCGAHGKAGQAFVCCHLVHEELAPAGFNEFEPDEDDSEPVAFCNDCTLIFDEVGFWTELVEKAVNLKLVCQFCFEMLRRLHTRGP
jgi:hypothetical protein